MRYHFEKLVRKKKKEKNTNSQNEKRTKRNNIDLEASK